jgi:hypothetical protein
MDKKGKIYKLYCDDGSYYYGSTTDKYLSKRFHSHKADSNKDAYKNNKVYSHIHSIGWDCVKCILVEEFDYTTREDMKRRENKYIVEGLPDPLCLNHNRAIISDSERLEKINERNKKLSEPLKVIVKCECGIEHTAGRSEQHKKSLKHRSLMEK